MKKQIENNSKIVVELKFKYSGWLFILDQLLRALLLVLYFKNYLPLWLFIILQVLLIVLLYYWNEKYKDRLNKKYIKYLNRRYRNENPTLKFNEEIPEILAIYQLLFGFFFSFWFIYKVIEPLAWYTYIFIFFLSLVGVVFCALPLAFSITYKESLGIISATPIRVKLRLNNNNEPTEIFEELGANYSDIFQSDKLIGHGVVQLDAVDQNDVKIAKLESEVKNINFKSETWMLESVFLGGLAFSGFLTVASANLLGKEPDVFKTFLEHLRLYFNNCSVDQTLSWLTEIQNHFFRNDLYIIIMLLCLMSSVFFLLVLTLRLRMNSLSLNMDHLLRILLIFNAKEEVLINTNINEQNQTNEKRLEKIQAKINSTLTDSEKLLQELRPISILMKIYRNIAVVLFYCVLIISGFYFMPMVSLIILSLALFTQVFRLLETYTKIDKIRNLLNRH